MNTKPKYKNDDVITDGLIIGRVIGYGSLGKFKNPLMGYEIFILTGRQSGQIGFIDEIDAKLNIVQSQTVNGMSGPKLEGWYSVPKDKNPYEKGSEDYMLWQDGKINRRFTDTFTDWNSKGDSK